MGYSHGQKWSFEKIRDEIMRISADTGIMPSFRKMYLETGNHGLSNAVSKHGGYKVIAEKLGLRMGKCETNFGRNYEITCLNKIEKLFALDCEQMTVTHPYDLLVSGAVKIDVKAAKKTKVRDSFIYSFNLEKRAQTCDIYVCYCTDNNRIAKTYVIPAVVLSGKCQLAVGINHSIYDKYIDQWHYIADYAEFMRGGIE